MYRSNIEKLEKWSGQVLYSRDSKKSNRHVLIECSIDFAYDANREWYRYNIEVTKDRRTENGEAMPRPPLQHRGGIYRDGNYYDVVYPIDRVDSPRNAFIRADKWMKPSYSYGTFEAMYFLTNQGTPFDEYWTMFYENAENPQLNGKIRLEEDTIVVEIDRGDGQNALKTVLR